MLYGYESLFEKKLKEHLGEIQTARRAAMEGGYPPDFPAYREAVGYLKALADFTDIVNMINDEMNKEDKER